jgi:steroid delta-isomerase-like uncharacterized protein
LIKMTEDPMASPSTLPHRSALLCLAGGGFGVAFAARDVGSTTAEEASPMAGAIPPLLLEWSEAWTAEDTERLLALYTPDAHFQDVAAGIDVHGQDELRGSFQAFMDALDGLAVTVEHGFRAGDWAAAEGTFSGTQTGPLGETPPTNRSFTVPFAAIFELQGDRIRRETDYFDLLSMLTQLGVVPASGMPATPTLGTPTP